MASWEKDTDELYVNVWTFTLFDRQNATGNWQLLWRDLHAIIPLRWPRTRLSARGRVRPGRR